MIFQINIEIILRFSKLKQYHFNQESIGVPYKKSTFVTGRTTLTGVLMMNALVNGTKGVNFQKLGGLTLQPLDINPAKFLGFQTQKPEALLNALSLPLPTRRHCCRFFLWLWHDSGSGTETRQAMDWM